MLFKKLRVSVEMSSNEECKQLGISKSMLYKLEEGKRKPSVDLVKKMSDTYNCGVNEIFQALNIDKQNLQE